MKRTARFWNRGILVLGLILLLGALLRLGLIVLAPAFTAYTDSIDYFAGGYGLVYGGQLDLPAKRPPVYPAFLGGTIALLGPSLEAAAIVQHGLGLLTVVLVYLLGATLWGRATGLIAALGVAVNGTLLLTEHTIASEAVFIPLLVGGLLALYRGLRSGRRATLLLAGLLFGLGVLTRSVAWAILPLALAAVAFGPLPRARRAAALGLVLLGFLLPVGPWIVHNAVQQEQAAPSSGLGDALFARIRRHDPDFEIRDLREPPADPEQASLHKATFRLAQQHRYASEVRDKLERDWHLTPAQSEAALRAVAFQVIRQEPERYLLGTAQMFGQLGLGFDKPVDRHWESRLDRRQVGYWPREIRFVMETGGRWPDSNQAAVERLVGLYQDHQAPWLTLPLFLLGAAGCFRNRQRWGWSLVLLPLLVVSQLLIYAALDGPLYRYRVPLQPVITLLIAAGLTSLLSWLYALGLRGRRLRPRVEAPAAS